MVEPAHAVDSFQPIRIIAGAHCGAAARAAQHAPGMPSLLGLLGLANHMQGGQRVAVREGWVVMATARQGMLHHARMQCQGCAQSTPRTAAGKGMSLGGFSALCGHAEYPHAACLAGRQVSMMLTFAACHPP